MRTVRYGQDVRDEDDERDVVVKASCGDTLSRHRMISETCNMFTQWTTVQGQTDKIKQINKLTK